MSVKFSVILTSYNKPEYLDRAISSVVNQSYDNWQLIVADDNSSKREVYSVIAKYQNDKRVRYFNSRIKEEDRLKTARYATQINSAVKELSTGDYICYLADDDYYYPLMLEKFSNSIDTYKRDIFYCCQEVVDTSGNKCGLRFPNEILDDGMDILDHNQVVTSRACFDSVNGWDDSPGCWGGADGFFWRKLGHAGYKFYPIDYTDPLQAKMYREKSVQWNIANNLDPSHE
jgi:spore maturation protein CgeD